MKLDNHSPLHNLPLTSRTPSGEQLSMVIVKLTFDLVPAKAAAGSRHFTHHLDFREDQEPLSYEDEYHGAFLESSLRRESDLAQGKPRCDLVVLCEAHAPGGKPCRRFQARVKLLAPDQARPEPRRPISLGCSFAGVTAEEERQWRAQAEYARTHPIPGKPLLDKRLEITGERWLRRRLLLFRVGWWFVKVLSFGLLRRCPWILTRPRPLRALPIRYEYAYGGHVRVPASTPWAGRVKQKDCLPGVDKALCRQAWKAKKDDRLLARGWWDENFVGRGYVPAWYLRASGLKRLPAPQIEDPAHPFTAKAAWKAMLGKATDRYRAALRPQGFGIIPRNWQPRLRLAGTWTRALVEEGVTYPHNYSPAFNNYAHPDLQCEYPTGRETVELTNLCEWTFPGAGRDAEGNTLLRFELPGFFPYLLVWPKEGPPSMVPAVLDTIILEPGDRKVTLLQRAAFPAAPEPYLVELRLAEPGDAPAASRCEAEDEEPPIPEKREVTIG